MKKITISLSLIGLVAALAIGATVAFYSDTETSTGNVLTAGTIDFTIDSFGAWYNGVQIPNSFFSATNLTNEKFFAIGDVKPGDLMERNISIHVDNNPAWVCLLVRNRENDENTLVDAEVDDGDTTPGVNGLGDGELGQNLHLLGWIDQNANRRLDGTEAPFVNSFFDVFTEIALHDSTTGNGPLSPTIPIEMVQLDLCGGTPVILPNGTVTCDGTSVHNQAQTDSLMADLVIYGEQHRNNENFKCSDLGQLHESD